MNSELKLLVTASADRRAWELLTEVAVESDFTPAGWTIYSKVGEFYTADPAIGRADLDIVEARILRDLPGGEKQGEPFKAIIRQIRETPSSGINVAREMLAQKRIAAGDRLVRQIASRQAGPDLEAARQEYNRLMEIDALDTEGQQDETDITRLFGEVRDDANKIRLLPGVINNAIGGGVRRGHTVVVFGRPNSGKSLFTLNATSGFLGQGLKVLYIENEDALVDNRARLVCRLVQKPERWVKQNLEQAAAMAAAAGYERYVLYDATPGTLAEIERAVIRHRPDVVVVNQIRHIEGGGKDNFTRALEQVANRLRALGKRYNFVLLLVTQARSILDRDGYEISKPVLYKEDIDSSHTGIPGAADLIIGYGTSPELRGQNMACLSIAKTKLREGRAKDGDFFYVRVDPSIDKLYTQET